MDNFWRPSHAFPPVEDTESVFHLINSQICKDIEKLAAEQWAKFPAPKTSAEQEHVLRESYLERARGLGFQPRIVQEFTVIATRTDTDGK